MRTTSDKQDRVLEHLRALEAAAIGAVEVKLSRISLKLAPDLPGARRLADRPPASGGFVRADDSSLLFRHAAQPLYDRITPELRERAMTSGKGLEFRWGQLADADIDALFDAVRELSGVGASGAPVSSS